MFGKVGISAPLIVGEVPRCVELLNERRKNSWRSEGEEREVASAGLEDPVVEEKESKDEEKKEKRQEEQE